MNKEVKDKYRLCEECGKYSPKGLRFDLDEPRKERKWRCDICFFSKRVI